MAVTVTLKGCTNGLGLGLNAKNVITQLDMGSPAATSGALQRGDRVIAVDGVKLRVRLFKGTQKLREVLRAADTHVLEIMPKGQRGIFAGILQRPRGRSGPSEPPKHTPKGRGAKLTSLDQHLASAGGAATLSSSKDEEAVSFSSTALGSVLPPNLGEAVAVPPQGGQMKRALAGTTNTPVPTRQPSTPHGSATRERPPRCVQQAQRDQFREAQRDRLRAANAAAIAREVAAADKVQAEADVALEIVQDMFRRDESARAKVRASSKR